MHDLQLRAFTESDGAGWDACVEGSVNGTFLHTRKFLSYHGERFADRSVSLHDAGGKLIAVFAAALDPSDAGVVVSHPGITYGGLVHAGDLTGGASISALQALMQHYAAQGLRSLLYKAVPHIYHRSPSQDDLYALFRLGAEPFRRDLSCTVDLAQPRRVSERRRRGVKRAERAGVRIESGLQRLPEFWGVLADNLAARHQASPVHSLAEIELLAQRFSADIELLVAVAGGRTVAGTVLFRSPRVCHAQYIGASDAGRELGALDLLFDTAIGKATESGQRFFDFGISTERGGSWLNEGLHDFKSCFGGGGVTYDFFRLNLMQPALYSSSD